VVGAVVQVVVRALSVLRLLARSPRGLSLGDISEQLEIPLATTHRTVAVLEEERFITRSTSNRKYFLGPAARELTHVNASRESPLVTAHRAVGEASRATGETVFLSELAGDKVVCVALSESKHPLRLYVRVGQAMPLHAAAAARVLLAWQPTSLVLKMLSDAPLTAYTPETPATINAVVDHLERVRKDGFDICASEFEENVWAVAAPVRSSTDEVVASITLAAPAHRVVEPEAKAHAREAVLSAAAEMSADLGWVPNPET
jgi:DNA-binding IclR family transcriptional regulator